MADSFQQPPLDAFHQQAEHAVAIAVLQTRMDTLERSVAELKTLVRETSQKVDGVASTLTEARGGWRALMLVGGASASLGAVGTWLLEHLPKLVK